MWYRRRGSWSSDSDDGCSVEVGLVVGAPAPPPVMVVQTAPMVQPLYTSSTVVVPGAYPSGYPMGVVPPQGPPAYQSPQPGVGYYPSPPPIPGPYPPDNIRKDSIHQFLLDNTILGRTICYQRSSLITNRNLVFLHPLSG